MTQPTKEMRFIFLSFLLLYSAVRTIMLDSELHPSIWMERQMKRAEETIIFSFVSGVLQRNEFFSLTLSNFIGMASHYYYCQASHP